jgi:hypothetical protein
MYRSKMVRILLLTLASVVGWAGAAKADSIQIVGTTDGCFDCTTSGPFLGTTTIAGLTFTGTSFDVTTDASGSVSISDLGGFTLDRTIAHDYNPDTFLLRVLFTVPTGIAGGGSTYAALLTGLITQTGKGTITIHFDDTFQLFAYSSGSGSGSFEFGIVSDPQLKETGPSDPTIRGAVRGATFTPGGGTTVPEPMSVLLFGSGLALVSRRLHRRFSQA